MLKQVFLIIFLILSVSSCTDTEGNEQLQNIKIGSIWHGSIMKDVINNGQNIDTTIFYQEIISFVNDSIFVYTLWPFKLPQPGNMRLFYEDMPGEYVIGIWKPGADHITVWSIMTYSQFPRPVLQDESLIFVDAARFMQGPTGEYAKVLFRGRKFSPPAPTDEKLFRTHMIVKDSIWLSIISDSLQLHYDR